MLERSRRSLIVITAATLAACFVDPGASTTSTSDATEASTSTSAGATTTSADASASSGAPATSTSSTGPATVSATSTGAPGCQVAPECQPGAVETAEICGDCSVERRVCGEDCSWGDWTCEPDEDVCGVWILPSGAREWSAHPIQLNGPAQYTPDDPIQAAFDFELSEIAYVLTEKEFHALDLQTLTWINRGDRQDMFDEASEQNLEGAISANIGLFQGGSASPTERVTLYSDENFWRFELSTDSTVGVFIEEGLCCAEIEEWQSPLAPNPADVRAIWLDFVGNPAWNPINLIDCPPLMNGVPLTSYAGFLVADDSVRLREFTTCAEFVGTSPYEDYAPFSLPNRPLAPDELGAALYHDGDLIVFKSDV